MGAHAGITAEGDNRVIQQKVSKELLQEVDKNQIFQDYAVSLLPDPLRRVVNNISGNICSEDWQRKVFSKRQSLLKSELALQMKKATDGRSKV